MEFKLKGDSMHVEAGPKYEGMFKLMMDDKVIYADRNREPKTGDKVVVLNNGATTIENYYGQVSATIFGVVVPNPKQK